MSPQETPILDLIPQRPPFVMVDGLVCCSDTDATTRFAIRQDNLFLEGGKLLSAGIIENMAQSCAARIGYIISQSDGPVRTGFLCDIRDLVITRQPQCGDVLLTRVSILQEVFNLTLAHVSVSIGDEPIATARLKIALNETE